MSGMPDAWKMIFIPLLMLEFWCAGAAGKIAWSVIRSADISIRYLSHIRRVQSRHAVYPRTQTLHQIDHFLRPSLREHDPLRIQAQTGLDRLRVVHLPVDPQFQTIMVWMHTGIMPFRRILDRDHTLILRDITG